MTESLYEIPLKSLNGQVLNLGAFKGQVLLIVNVASKCGLTPQYAGLESLFKQYRERGLQVLGFPCNDFAAQEPGSENLAGYGCSPKQPDDVLWNFEKFLVGRDGRVVQRFSPDMTPDDPILLAAIESALA